MNKSEKEKVKIDKKDTVDNATKQDLIKLPLLRRKILIFFIFIFCILITFLYFLVKFLFGYMLVDLKNAPLQLLALRWKEDKVLVETPTEISICKNSRIKEKVVTELPNFIFTGLKEGEGDFFKDSLRIVPNGLEYLEEFFKIDSQLDSFILFYKIRSEFIKRGPVVKKRLEKCPIFDSESPYSFFRDEFKYYNFLGKDEIEELFSGTFADLLNLFKLLKVEFHEFLESRKGGKSGYLSPKCLYVDIQKPHSDLKFSLLLKYLVGKIIDLLPGAKDSFFGPLADKEGFKGTVALTVEDVENSMRRLCLAKPVVGDTLIHNIFSVLFVFSFDKDDVDKMVDEIPYLKTLKDNYIKALFAANFSPTAIETLRTAFESQKMLAFHHLYSLILTSLFKIDSEAYPYPAVAEKDPRSLLYRLFGISALKDEVKETEQISDAFRKCWNHDASVRDLKNG